MKTIPCENCPCFSTILDGSIAGEKAFKFHAVINHDYEMVGCLCQLERASAGFSGYLTDESGKTVGAKIRCNLGYGYDFDHGYETVELHPGESHSFLHSYSDTSEGSWDEGSTHIRLTLLPFDEAECRF